MREQLPLHSIVVPVFNEVDGIPFLLRRLKSVVQRIYPSPVEIILIDDGSQDGSADALDRAAIEDPLFKVIHLSRNFGHQLAITAGIEWATGETVTVIDADLQDPPEVILQMLEKWREGFDVVFAVRRKRPGETPFKLWTAKLFYRLIRRITQVTIPVDTGDFRLMDRKAVDALMRMREHHRFIRGMVSWTGFRQTGIEYDRAERAHGQTHYPLKKMIRFALDGITSFSALPLQLATYVGAASALIAVMTAFWALYVRFFTDHAIPGWTSTVLIMLFLGSVQLISLGIFGEYLGRVYDEVKGRPLYLISKAVGFERERDLKANPSWNSRQAEIS